MQANLKKICEKFLTYSSGIKGRIEINLTVLLQNLDLTYPCLQQTFCFGWTQFVSKLNVKYDIYSKHFLLVLFCNRAPRIALSVRPSVAEKYCIRDMCCASHMHQSQGSRIIDKCIIHACIRIMYKCIIGMYKCIRVKNICIAHTKKLI